MRGILTGCVALAVAMAMIAVAGAGFAAEPSQAIGKAVGSAARSEADVQRDAGRKPAEVLAFFGIEPGMKVADLVAGGGYYSDILCRVVGPEGKVWIHNNEYVLDKFGKFINPALEKRLAQPELAHCARLDTELDSTGLPDGSLDAVLMVLWYHDSFWHPLDRGKMNAEILRVLKPGGTFGVVDHHAEAGSGARDVKTIHRMDAKLAKDDIVAAGFEFVAETEVLRNAEDDHTKNVFDPSIRGKTDRFVYKFRKPDA